MRARMIAVSIAMISLMWGCSDPGEEPPPQKAFLNIRLTDAPAAYDEVNIEILQVGAFIDDVWYDFTLSNPGIYDLISLTSGTPLLLVQGVEVPSGLLTQMRLFLGENNSIMIDGEYSELITPSGQTSGYKAKIEQVITGPNTYQVILDFDAEQSIVSTGNEKYILKPVIRAYLATEVGQIAGTVEPTGAGLHARAFNSTDTCGTYIDQGSGGFIIGGLHQGSYTVRITPNPGYLEKLIENVIVTEGNMTILGIITLDEE